MSGLSLKSTDLSDSPDLGCLCCITVCGPLISTTAIKVKTEGPYTCKTKFQIRFKTRNKRVGHNDMIDGLKVKLMVDFQYWEL